MLGLHDGSLATVSVVTDVHDWQDEISIIRGGVEPAASPVEGWVFKVVVESHARCIRVTCVAAATQFSDIILRDAVADVLAQDLGVAGLNVASLAYDTGILLMSTVMASPVLCSTGLDVSRVLSTAQVIQPDLTRALTKQFH